MARRRTAVLISGSGSNLQALIEASRDPAFPAAIALVLANRPDAYGLVRAARAGIPTVVLKHGAFAGREAFDDAVAARLDAHGIELACLAGFMRVLGAALVGRWAGRMLNIHPSLLPALPGLRTHARALAAGLAVHGCTVHLVTPELDAGPPLVQGVVPVLPGDDAESLGRRVLEVEHRAYPRGLALLASDRVALAGGRAVLADERPGERLILHPSLAGPDP